MTSVKLTSASGLLALLTEEDSTLKEYALKSLLRVVDDHWSEVASSLSVVESLYEDEDFPQRGHAALLASKVFYHLLELNESLTYALGAGELFDVSDNSEYVQTLVAKCIDEYVDLRVKEAEGKGEEAPIDARLTSIVERMFERCFRDGQYRQAIGIALETRRLDKLEEAIMMCEDINDALSYTLKASLKLITSRDFRCKVLLVLVKLYETASSVPDFMSVCTCLVFLDDHSTVAKILDQLISDADEEKALLAFQIGFDLFENEIPQFLLKVRDEISALAPPPPVPPAPAPASAAGPDEAGKENTPEEEASGAVDSMDTEEAPAVEADLPPTESQMSAIEELTGRLSPTYQARWGKLKTILSGDASIGLHLQFLSSHNKADLLILKTMKNSIETRNSVCHSATILANAVMHAGTTCDTFLRENLDWLSRATNWAKFSATAGLGVIHRGHLSQGRSLMEPYLPRGNLASVSPYSEGGALYALGLIHVDQGAGIRDFLLESLRNTSNDVIQHGACLGLGLASLGTGDSTVYEDIKGVLYSESAVAGEAAGIGMGLLLAGTGSEKTEEMLQYAHDTQHEKIIQGLSLGCALTVYGREEEADTLIETLSRDADPILRYGGMYATALAYRGTGNNSAVRRLLHFAVSDVSDNVRRAAVLSLGFVLYQTPEQCPRVVALLAESYNPHMRYGAAMAVGISCSGTGLKEAIGLLEPLVTDAVDYVRQGALLAMAMVLIQQPESRVTGFRKQLDKIIADKHEEVMCKKGAIMAAGILDAGGRNVTVGLRSRSANHRMAAVLGMAVFTQYWYWYPLAYFISLPLRPSALICLNAELKMPKFTSTSACKPSLFAYAPPLSSTTTTQVSKAPTAVLSTTAKARAKAKRDAEKKAESKPSTPATNTTETDSVMETEEPTARAASPEEPTSEQLENPARVVPAQEKYIKFQEGIGVRYLPLKMTPPAGIIVMKDTRPDLPVELVDITEPTPSTAQAVATAPPIEEEEPAPPEPFEYSLS